MRFKNLSDVEFERICKINRKHLQDFMAKPGITVAIVLYIGLFTTILIGILNQGLFTLNHVLPIVAIFWTGMVLTSVVMFLVHKVNYLQAEILNRESAIQNLTRNLNDIRENNEKKTDNAVKLRLVK
ncbi:MAG: hypothetical protein ACOH5I_26050 [Oligoflexus sp.]